MTPTRYSPVTTDAAGRVTVELAADHPGVCDPIYRARRDELAALAAAWKPGWPIPRPRYSEQEHEVWRVVSAELAQLHEQYASSVFLAGKEALGLPTDRIPQLDEVTVDLVPHCGFRYQPVAGLAPLRDFYRSFGDGVFWSTQYLRHPSVPLYTPEPDVIHEVIGHANQLAGPGIASLYRLVGRAVDRAPDDAQLRAISQVFWYTLEFGVVRERGELRALGAGILSSVGETSTFREAELRPADLEAMAAGSYDITRYQPVLYVWGSWAQLEDELSAWLWRRTLDDQAQHAVGR
jgi:phenylalanine-4-hydroxylase